MAEAAAAGGAAADIACDALKEFFPLSLADFNVGVTLGTGSFGRVKFGTHKVRVPSFPSSMWDFLEA